MMRLPPNRCAKSSGPGVADGGRRLWLMTAEPHCCDPRLLIARTSLHVC